jgi:hypothetical protein
MRVTAAAPQPGDGLTIAGYGSGSWRMASGRCTQYLAPGIEFPHEMVELATEARQGDSGGPILNDRGELAGVLFGSGPGYTSGSYGGRVLKFLATVVPGGAPSAEGPPANALPSDRALASADPSPARSAIDCFANTPSPTALHDKPADSLTPAYKSSPDPLLTPPPAAEVASRFGPAASSPAAAAVDPRVAVTPSRLDLEMPPLPTASSSAAPPQPAVFASPLTPRGGEPAASLDHAPPEKLLALLWRRFGGTTIFDQTKSVLAIVGLLSIAVVFLRFGSRKEAPHEEE